MLHDPDAVWDRISLARSLVREDRQDGSIESSRQMWEGDLIVSELPIDSRTSSCTPWVSAGVSRKCKLLTASHAYCTVRRAKFCRSILQKRKTERSLKHVLVVQVMTLYSNVSLVIADEEHFLSAEDSRVIPLKSKDWSNWPSPSSSFQPSYLEDHHWQWPTSETEEASWSKSAEHGWSGCAYGYGAFDAINGNGSGVHTARTHGVYHSKLDWVLVVSATSGKRAALWKSNDCARGASSGVASNLPVSQGGQTALLRSSWPDVNDNYPQWYVLTKVEWGEMGGAVRLCGWIGVWSAKRGEAMSVTLARP